MRKILSINGPSLIVVLLCVFAVTLAPSSVRAANSEIKFSSDGTFTATNVVVSQKAGTNLFSRAVWESTYFRFVIVTSPSTVITKSHGESATIADVGEQHIINVSGTLATGGDSIVINAKTIQDTDLLSAAKTLSGAVVSVDVAKQNFVVNDKAFGKTTVSISGASITKGARSVSLAELKAGDKVLSAAGTYDYTTKTLSATAIEVHQDASVFKSRNFEGKLKSLSGTALPVTLVVSVGSTEYTVYLPEGSIVWNKAKATASLSRFVVGDTVRFYGAIRTTNLIEVDAEILRDLNF